MTIRVITLGCKVNQCESASIVAALNEHNHKASEGLEPADAYVLNTCSVTAEADKKSRQYLTKMRKLNPSCSIIVVGCSSQNNSDCFKQNNVVAIGGTTDKCNFVLNAVDKISLNNHYNTLSDIIVFDKNQQEITKYCPYSHENMSISNKTRAFVKIQDGCNRFCSYCIIPYLRGRSRSRSIESIFEECSNLPSKEIVLTGIDMSMYGLDIGHSLQSLLSALSSIPARKRLGSLECEVITDGLLSVMKEGDYCPHFHLSLQSGDNDVLRSMNRRYDQDFFYEKIKLIREYFPLAGITTDVIAGFPTETDERFEKSCEFIKSCEFSDIHVFPYSAREGTLAARKYAVLPPKTLKRRVGVLLGIKTELRERFISKNLGTVASVYTENREGIYNVGYTPNYIKVYSDAPCGEITDLCLVRQYESGIFGELKK